MSRRRGIWTLEASRVTARGLNFLAPTVLLAAVLGILISRWPMPVALAMVALLVVVGEASSREVGLGAILVCALTMLGIASSLGLPIQAALLTKAFIGVFAATVLFDVGPDNPLRIPLPFIMLTCVLVVSAVFGTANRFYALQSLVTYLIAPIAFVAIVHSRISIESLKRLAWVVIGIVALQLPLVLVQAPFAATVDRIGGTFGAYGGTAIQAVLMPLAWTAAVAILTGRKRIWLLPIAFAVATVLLVSEAKAGFIFCALGTVVVGLTKVVANPRRGLQTALQYTAAAVASVAALFGGYVYVGSLLPGGQTMATYWLAWLKDPSAIMAYLFSYGPNGQAGRFESVRLALTQSRTAADLLIGQGPGTLSSSALLGQTAIAAGAAFDWTTSATRALLETGGLGLAFMVVAICYAVFAVGKPWKWREDPVGAGVTAAAAGMAAIYFAAAFYAEPWFGEPIGVVFWCVLAMAVKWGRLRLVEPSPAASPSVPSI